MTKESNTYKSAQHPFDLLVLATSESTLSEEAFALLHKDDTYFNQEKMDAWKIWYCFDNDTDRFEWVDENCKGVIYRMIDENNNVFYCLGYYHMTNNIFNCCSITTFALKNSIIDVYGYNENSYMLGCIVDTNQGITIKGMSNEFIIGQNCDGLKLINSAKIFIGSDSRNNLITNSSYIYLRTCANDNIIDNSSGLYLNNYISYCKFDSGCDYIIFGEINGYGEIDLAQFQWAVYSNLKFKSCKNIQIIPSHFDPKIESINNYIINTFTYDTTGTENWIKLSNITRPLLSGSDYTVTSPLDMEYRYIVNGGKENTAVIKTLFGETIGDATVTE